MTNKAFETEQNRIKDLDKQWGEAATAALAAGATDAEFKRLTDLYSQDGTVAWPGFEIGRGAAEIEARWRKAHDDFKDSKLKFNPISIEIVGGLAIDFGQVVFTSDGKVDDGNKYLVIWRNEHGAWKVYYDCWNSNHG